MKDDISLAQWALVEEFHSGKLTTLDLPRTARVDFGLNGIELVNTLLEVPTQTYLDRLKEYAAEYKTAIVLIMVDDEGDGCASTPQGRKQFVINHRKWIDIARYLGCGAIRTNCRGEAGVTQEDGWSWAEESYRMLLEHAEKEGIRILIENHGGLSNDADWMVKLYNRVAHPLLGSYPDWREPSPDFDPVDYLQKVLPFAGGMSYRNQPTEALTAHMIDLCRRSGYTGWWGIESNGRDAVRKGIGLLSKYLGL